MAGLLIFIGIGIIFATLMRAERHKRLRDQERRNRQPDDGCRDE